MTKDKEIKRRKIEMKKIPTWSITVVALLLSILLAANFIKANKDVARQARNSDSDEKILILAKTDFNEIKDALGQYPENLTQKIALEQGFIVTQGEELKGESVELWKNFCQKVAKNKEGAVLIASYTIEGDAIVQYIAHRDGTFYYVEDTTRDEYGTQGYATHKYSYLKRFDDDGTYYAALSAKDDVTVEEVKNSKSLKDSAVVLTLPSKELE